MHQLKKPPTCPSFYSSIETELDLVAILTDAIAPRNTYYYLYLLQTNTDKMIFVSLSY